MHRRSSFLEERILYAPCNKLRGQFRYTRPWKRAVESPTPSGSSAPLLLVNDVQ